MPHTAMSQSKIEKAEARKRLFAMRYKTEMCRTFEVQGYCPYGCKCMFAHGALDMRSEALNERDGLTSAYAVKLWMQQNPEYHRHRSFESGSEDHSEPHQHDRQHSDIGSDVSSCEVVGKTSPRPAGVWRHEPYSWVQPFVTCRVH